MTDSANIYNTLLTTNKSFRKAVSGQVEQMIQAQSTALERLEDMTDAWFHRRREALDSVADTWQRASQVNNAAELWSLYGEWISNELHRLSTDFSAVTQRVTEMGEHTRDAAMSFGSHLTEAGQDVAKQTAQTMNSVHVEEKRASGGKRTVQEAA